MWMNKKIFSGIRMVRPLKKAAVCFAAAGFLGGLAFCAPAWAQDDPVSMDVSPYVRFLTDSANGKSRQKTNFRFRLLPIF